MSTTDPQASAPKRFGRYVLLDRIGRGGMAEVYRARTYGPGGFFKEIAVKQILPTLLDDRSFVAMFVDEARLTAFLNHPNIVQVVDLGEVDRKLYIGMEFVAGKDLLDILAGCARRSTRLSLEHVLLVITSVLAGLDYAHNAVNEAGQAIRVVHRDVSPSNVLVGYNGHVKIGDFGIAKSGLQSTRTDVGTQKGKLGYMSPEQVTGAAIDHRSDVFAAAVILFEMLTMSRLFKARNDLDVMLKIRDGNLAADLEKLRDYPESLQSIVRRGLEVDPERRFESAGRFLEAIYHVVQDLNLVLRPASLGSFLGELFADDITEERQRRLEDPDPVSCYDANLRSTEANFRYRDAAGTVHGPFTLHRAQELLRKGMPDARERVSYLNGPWLPVRRFVDLCDVPRPVDPDASQITLSATPFPVRTTADWEDLALAAINPNRARKLRKAGAGADPGSSAIPATQGRSERVLPVTSPRRNAYANGAAAATLRTSNGRSNPPPVDLREQSALPVPGDSSLGPSNRRGESAPSTPAHGRTTSSAVAASDRAWMAATPRAASPDPSLTAMPDGASELSADEASSLDDLLHAPAQRVVAAASGAAHRGPVARAGAGPSTSGLGMHSGPGSSQRPYGGTSSPGGAGHISRMATPGPLGPAASGISQPGAHARASASTSTNGTAGRRDGVIGSSGMVRVLFQFWKNRANGRLEVEDGRQSIVLDFDQGVPQVADTPESHERFAELVTRRKWVASERIYALLGRAGAEGAPFLDEVTRRGLVSPQQVMEALGEMVQDAVLDIVECFQGRWLFTPAAPRPPGGLTMQVHLPSLLARGVQERLGPGFFTAYFRMLRSSTVQIQSSARSAERLQLSARALRMLHNARPATTVQEMVDHFNERFGWSEDETLHNLYLLIEFELFSVNTPW